MDCAPAGRQTLELGVPSVEVLYVPAQALLGKVAKKMGLLNINMKKLRAFARERFVVLVCCFCSMLSLYNSILYWFLRFNKEPSVEERLVY